MDIQNGCKMSYFLNTKMGQVGGYLENVVFKGCTFEKPLNGDHLSFYNVKFINCGSIPVQNWNTLHLDGCEFENTSTSVSGVGVVGFSF